jgi:hypothetical protein
MSGGLQNELQRQRGSHKIDADYLDALLDAVPRKGQSFTYSHFDPRVYGWGKKLAKVKPLLIFAPILCRRAASIYNGVPSVCRGPG